MPTKRKNTKTKKQSDGTFFLKLTLYLMVGSQWVWFVDTSTGLGTFFPLPIGLLAGLAFASHEHFQTDKKIEYAVLLIAMFVGFWTRIGIFIQV